MSGLEKQDYRVNKMIVSQFESGSIPPIDDYNLDNVSPKFQNYT